MAITINPIFPVIGAQGVENGAENGVALQPGTVIAAKVLKVLEANLVRIAIASLSIEALTEVPLQAGQTLQLAVSQTPQGVKLAIVPQTDGGDASPDLGAQGANALASTPKDSPATSLAPNIAASKIAASLNAPADVNAARPLTNIEALAVSAAVQTAAAKQGSLSPLFANLAVAASSSSLPPIIQQAASVLLALRPGLDGNISGDDIKVAFEKSGLFFEQSQATTKNAPTLVPANLANEQPDLKAALIVFRQTVASWLGSAPSQSPTAPQTTAALTLAAGEADITNASANTSANLSASNPAPPQSASAVQTANGLQTRIPSPSLVLSSSAGVDENNLQQTSSRLTGEATAQDIKARGPVMPDVLPGAASRAAPAHAGLESLQDVLQAFPKGVADAVHAMLDNEAGMKSVLNVGTTRGNQDPDSTDAPPPFRGAAPSAQPAALPSFAQDSEPVGVARHLVSDADAAIARQTLLQIASLPDRVDMQGVRQDVNTPRWNFEIPFATPQGHTAVAQFEISRDGGGDAVSSSQRIWKARFSLNVEPTGPIHALVTLAGERASVRMWAERPSTTAQLRANAPQLTHALREAALEPGDIVIGDGAPPQATKPPAGHFLDRAL